MIDDDTFIDGDVLIFTLLRQALLEHDPPVEVSADIDTTALDELPYVTFNLVGDAQNGGPGLYFFTLNISVFAEGMDATKALAQELYALVHAWNGNELAAVEGIGWVNSVTDDSVFTRQASADVGGRNTTQYVGSFALALRN